MPEVILQLKEKFGDVYQVWIGAMLMIVINSLEDAQHIFSHRLIYDQGDIFTEKFKLINPNEIICLKGSSVCFNNSLFLGAKFKQHATFTGPLFRRGKILIHFNTIITR